MKLNHAAGRKQAIPEWFWFWTVKVSSIYCSSK